MLRLREMRSVLEKAKTQGVSMQRRLVLYWFSMALAILAAVLLVVSLTGVFSNTAQKFGQSLTIQKHNTASALAGQMDQLTAQSIALSEELTRELDKQLAAVVLVPEIGLRTLEARSRMVWIAGSLVFLAAMLLLSTYLSRRFVTPISRSLQAIREQAPGEHPSGISEIDELLAFVRSRAAEQLTAGSLPPNIEELLSGFRSRVQTLTPMERTVLQYYIDGCSLEEVAARAYISVATAKKHNTNINRKLGVTSREELMLYIDLFRRCGRLDEIAAPRAEDTARCTT